MAFLNLSFFNDGCKKQLDDDDDKKYAYNLCAIETLLFGASSLSVSPISVHVSVLGVLWGISVWFAPVINTSSTRFACL